MIYHTRIYYVSDLLNCQSKVNGWIEINPSCSLSKSPTNKYSWFSGELIYKLAPIKLYFWISKFWSDKSINIRFSKKLKFIWNSKISNIVIKNIDSISYPCSKYPSVPIRIVYSVRFGFPLKVTVECCQNKHFGLRNLLCHIFKEFNYHKMVQ